jgi:hypothetical protein
MRLLNVETQLLVDGVKEESRCDVSTVHAKSAYPFAAQLRANTPIHTPPSSQHQH